jgi:GntR family transcriptional regulator
MPLTASQIAAELADSIRSGELQPGMLMPSGRELIERFGTTKSTAGKAIALLQAEGLVRTETGRGTFVQDIPKVKRVRRIPPRGNGSGSGFAEEMRKAGLTPTTKLIQAEAGIPPADVAGRLELGDDEQALIRKRHMFTDGRPAQLAVSYIPLSVAGSSDLAFPDTGPTGIHARLADRGHRVERFVGRSRIAPPGRGRSSVPADQPNPARPRGDTPCIRADRPGTGGYGQRVPEQPLAAELRTGAVCGGTACTV